MNLQKISIKRAAPWAIALGSLGISGGLLAQQLGYTDTPFLPGSKYRVHDAARPQPRKVDPGTPSTADKPGIPPSDAVVLFDGKDLSKWKNDKGGEATWTVEDGVITVKPGGGSMISREEFGDSHYHIEMASPSVVKGNGQGRGNSGIILFGLYEIQVLDGWNNPTYADGTTAAIYGQYPPLVNATRKPGEWQTYDILFKVPRFKDGKLETPGVVTVLLNGVAVHHATNILGAVSHRDLPKLTPHGPKGSLLLQDHGDLVKFRNIWVREMKEYDVP